MKKIVFVFLLISLSATLVCAQDLEDTLSKGFKKENLFTGGTVNVSFFNGRTILGANPIFGYRFAKWIDAGAAINFTYSGQRDFRQLNDKARQYVYGGGLFTRIYPVNFLFLQAQLEHNFIKFKYTPSSSNYLPFNDTFDSNSLLVGAGYTQGRQPGSNTFYYISILVDVIKSENSPYVNIVEDQNTGQRSVRAVPLIRAGFNIGLFEGKNKGQ
jgi:hypothetical protein